VSWIDWGLLIVRVVIVFFALMIAVLLYIWMERKVIADMQTRVGPMRAGPRGVLITLADGIKLFFKEGIRPSQADPWVYRLAPMFAIIPGFLAFAIVPFGPSVHIFGRTVGMQLTDLPIGILWVLAMTSSREGWGMIVTEAAACGTPAVVTRVPGFVDAVVEGETGLLGDTRDDLASGLESVLTDAALRARLGERAREHASRYTWEATARGTLEVLAQAAVRRRSRQ